MYAFKHLLYLLDTLARMKITMKEGPNKDKPQKVKIMLAVLSLVGPFLTCIMWFAYTFYGFLYKWGEVYAGVELRQTLDIKEHAEKQLEDEINIVTSDEITKKAMEIYKMEYSWLLPLIVALTNYGLLIYTSLSNFSSMDTNLGVSTFVVPLQMVYLSLFFEGRLIHSNITDGKPNDDTYEARNVFAFIYYPALLGLPFSAICILLAVRKYRIAKLATLKWTLWAIWWILAFVFVLLMDDILFQRTVSSLKACKGIYTVGWLLSVCLAGVSIHRKVKKGDHVERVEVEEGQRSCWWRVFFGK